MRSILCAAAFAALFAGLSVAKAQTLYLTAERLIDPVSGRVIESPALLIEGGKIVAAGAREPYCPGRHACH